MVYQVIVMKKVRENMFLFFKILLAVSAVVFCTVGTLRVKAAVSDAVMRCLTTVIPSLYRMMILSGFLIKSGLTERFPPFITKIGKFLFGMDGGIFPIFIISMFAGYPVGAKMLCAEAENGAIDRRTAELLAGVCFEAGPAFIFGCISSQLYGEPTAGRLIIISTISANVIIALLLSPKIRKKSFRSSESGRLRLTADTLTESILGGGPSMADICIMIAVFSIISSFLDCSGILGMGAELISKAAGISAEYSEGLLRAFLDVTAVDTLPQGNYNLLPAVCGLTSFGEICVIMQISAITSGKIGIAPMLIIRSAAAFLSGAVCRFLMTFMLSDTAVSAAELNFSMHRADSPVPSFLLIIMTLLLFREYEKAPRKNSKL